MPHGLRICMLTLLLAVLSGCFVITGNFNPFGQAPEPLEERVVAGEGADKVLLLDISRTITTEEQEQAFGLRRQASTVARVEEALQRAARDDRVKAVVLRIDSPGDTRFLPMEVVDKFNAKYGETTTGDRSEIDLPDHYQTWKDLSATGETCVGKECLRFEDCFVQQATACRVWRSSRKAWVPLLCPRPLP